MIKVEKFFFSLVFMVYSIKPVSDFSFVKSAWTSVVCAYVYPVYVYECLNVCMPWLSMNKNEYECIIT